MELVFNGDQMRKLRILAGLSTAELAKKIATTSRSVQRWEMGTSAPRPRYVKRMASVFHVAQKELYCEGQAVEA